MPPADLAAHDVADPCGTADTEIDGYEMANLFPRTTGLPLAVWVSPRGQARHDARVKVCLAPGKMDIVNVAVVGIRPQPWLVAGRLGTAEFGLVAKWIILNETALMAFRDKAIDSIELGASLKKLEVDGATR